MNEIQPIVVDLGVARRGELNESFLEMFGGMMKGVLGRMFGYNTTPITVRGNRREIDSFTKLLSKEKNYMNAFQKYGLNDPSTINNKHKLDRAVAQFEKSTGIKYPLK
jgi:hypothetical protein